MTAGEVERLRAELAEKREELERAYLRAGELEERIEQLSRRGTAATYLERLLQVRLTLGNHAMPLSLDAARHDIAAALQIVDDVLEDIGGEGELKPVITVPVPKAWFMLGDGSATPDSPRQAEAWIGLELYAGGLVRWRDNPGGGQ